MARLPTCPDCGVGVADKDTAKKISGRWVCQDCLVERERINSERQELYLYIAEIFNINFPTGMMMKQIKEFREDLGYTYKGMFLTLQYWCKTMGNSMANARGVGIIPYIYEDAKTFFIEKMKVEKKIAEEGVLTPDKKIVNVRKQASQEIKTHRKPIDMSDL